jgi:phosphoesterase RecJ-like protein
MAQDTKVPDMYEFLPDVKKIKTHLDRLKEKTDVVIIVDCASTKRTGKAEKLISDQVIVNIDHHPGRRTKMDYVLKDTKTAATSELIYLLFKEMKVKIDKKTALLLYVGIETDTGSFKYTNTTSQTHMIVAELLDKGADPDYVNKKIYESESPKKLKLLALCLDTLELFKEGKIAAVKTTKSMYKKTNSGPEYTENFVNFPRRIKAVQVAVFFKEEKRGNKTKVSFRSKGQIDVDKIARVFGGGGHPEAAGCTLKGKIEDNKNRVIKEIKKHVK